MKILVIGGTKFFGIHMVNALLTKGHAITIATRGRAADPFGDKIADEFAACEPKKKVSGKL